MNNVLHSNYIFFIGIIIVLLMLYLLLKKLPIKIKKKETQTAKSEEDKNQEQSEKIIRVKKAKLKPNIEAVYQRQQSTEDVKDKVEEESVVIDNKEAQFVKTSNKVSRFIGFSDIQKKEEELQKFAELELQENFNPDDNCELCKSGITHFDHTRRLSKSIQSDNFDDLFMSHIGEKYLNIDSNRHLNRVEQMTNSLFEKASKTLINSDVKVLVDEDDSDDLPVNKIKNDKDFKKDWLDTKKQIYMQNLVCENGHKLQNCDCDEVFLEEVSEDLDLSPKNLMVVDAIINRKKIRK